MHGIFCRSLNLCSKCLPYLHQQLGETKVCAEWIPHVLSNDQRPMCILLVTICLQCWRNENNAVLDCILMVDESWMHSFHPQLKRQNVDWHSQTSLRKNIAWHSQGALKVVHVMFFSWNIDQWPSYQLVWGSVANFTVHSCRIRWGGLFTVNNLNRLSMVSFCSRIKQHPIIIVMCKILCHFGAGRCWHILPTLQILPYVITGCLHVWKNIFG